ncbi:MAG: 8-amino-7-oxononanoate synthase [Cytophagales bacterium]|nr:8-amino-7-oxononanoate synthase [Cytophagales bacterium]
MIPEHLNEWQAELNRLDASGSLRRLRTIQTDGSKTLVNGRPMLNLCSNDYLGFAQDRELQQKFFENCSESNALSHFGMGASSSRLLCGNHPPYQELEDDIEQAYGKPALFFNSGYHANLGILPVLAQKGDLILSDKLNHASITDGLRLSQADFLRYRHLDYEHLEKLLRKKRSQYKRVFIVTESVFSMDGDAANLPSLCKTAKVYGAFLYVDEAHSIGVRGERGLGLAEEQGVLNDIDLLVAPFGKAMASQGAFAVCHKTIKDYLINHMRPFIFTTALPPVTVSWNRFIFRHMLQAKEKRAELNRLERFARKCLNKTPFSSPSESNILPVIVGDNQQCVILAEHLQKMGFLALPVRPPTVPKGTARLRVSLTAQLKEEELDSFFNTLHSLAYENGLVNPSEQ